jgi:peptide/nickel transport system ATP-binding protein
MDKHEERILEMRNVTTKFRFGEKELVAVNDVSLSVDRREIVGIVGESGCGKSMTAFSILGIVPHPGEVAGGEILFKGVNLLGAKERKLRKLRGSGISLVCQDPLSSLNPSFNIYWHLNEVLKAHEGRMPRKEKERLILSALKRVGIPSPEEKVNQYPHQFSGGMRQRVVISMALILNPALIIADEPTTALDVTTQKEIFNLIEKLKEELLLSFIVISHDLYLIGERCDRIYVMYSGQIVESGMSVDIFDKPLHPYTMGLLNSIPKLQPGVRELETIEGEVQNLLELPRACFFAGRCRFADGRCRSTLQVLEEIEKGRMARCWKAKERLLGTTARS